MAKKKLAVFAAMASLVALAVAISWILWKGNFTSREGRDNKGNRGASVRKPQS